MRYPATPDGRYFVVRGRLWRCTDPGLPAERRAELTRELMDARRDKGRAMRAGDGQGREEARQRVGQAGARRARRGLVDGRRAGLEPAHGPQHALFGVVRGVAEWRYAANLKTGAASKDESRDFMSDQTSLHSVDNEFLVKAAAIAESLKCLTFLMRAEVEDRERLDLYFDLADERLMALWELIHSIR